VVNAALSSASAIGLRQILPTQTMSMLLNKSGPLVVECRITKVTRNK
jgi:hypothetical protein